MELYCRITRIITLEVLEEQIFEVTQILAYWYLFSVVYVLKTTFLNSNLSVVIYFHNLSYTQFIIVPTNQWKIKFSCGTLVFGLTPFGFCKVLITVQNNTIEIFYNEKFLKTFLDDFSILGSSFDICLQDLYPLPSWDVINLMLKVTLITKSNSGGLKRPHNFNNFCLLIMVLICVLSVESCESTNAGMIHLFLIYIICIYVD